MKSVRFRLSTILGLAACAGAFYWWSVSPPARPAPPSPGSVSPASKWAVLFDNSCPLPERLALTERIDASLDVVPVETWAATLRAANNNRDIENDLVVWNSIVGQWRTLNLHSGAVTSFLIRTLKNPALHPVVRDYAAQHLARHLMTPSQPGQELLTAEAITVLCSVATTLPTGSAGPAGTALLSLADLAAFDPALLVPHWPTLDSAIPQLIAGSGTSDPLRLGAIQAAGAMRRPSFHQPLRELLGRPVVPDAVRLAGVAALRSYADPADRPLIEALAAHGGFAAAAASSALQSAPYSR